MAIERKISFFLHFVYPRGFLSYLKLNSMPSLAQAVSMAMLI